MSFFIRYSQNYTIVLVPHTDPNEPYTAVGKCSILQPECGMSFLLKKPFGRPPDPMKFSPWAAEFVKFLKHIDQYFEGDAFEYVRKD